MRAWVHLSFMAFLTASFAMALVPSAQAALYEDLEFTVVVADAADHVGFLDMREFAIAEPGDDTIVMRITVEDFGTTAGGASVHVFFSAPAGSFRAGVADDGSPTTHSSSPGGYDTCEVDGDTAYCVMTYATLGASVGDQLTGIYGISYQGAAQDHAPGTIGLVEITAGLAGLPARGDDYTLVGSTVVSSGEEGGDSGGSGGSGNNTGNGTGSGGGGSGGSGTGGSGGNGTGGSGGNGTSGGSGGNSTGGSGGNGTGGSGGNGTGSGTNGTAGNQTTNSTSNETAEPQSTKSSFGNPLDNPGYLGTSAAGVLAAVVLGIVGIAVRWKQ